MCQLTEEATSPAAIIDQTTAWCPSSGKTPLQPVSMSCYNHFGGRPGVDVWKEPCYVSFVYQPRLAVTGTEHLAGEGEIGEQGLKQQEAQRRDISTRPFCHGSARSDTSKFWDEFFIQESCVSCVSHGHSLPWVAALPPPPLRLSTEPRRSKVKWE